MLALSSFITEYIQMQQKHGNIMILMRINGRKDGELHTKIQVY